VSITCSAACCGKAIYCITTDTGVTNHALK